ncbi:MAG: metallophosphoesterase, partial [Anaerolineae bacterium]|nr:metallophosphoesterase [Anaerolineae bacterium]
DAYKDRTPVPTFQREWGRRMMRLSQARIPTLLLVGNHDLSPSAARAHALQEYETLSIPYIQCVSRPRLLVPETLFNVPVQVLALPWVSRSSLMAALNLSAEDPRDVYAQLEERLGALVQIWLEQVDPSLPVVLTAHGSVEGAVYGGERTVMLGADLVLQRSLVRDERLDYVALGHIHKPQNLDEGGHHPIIYPGSIERVDFGEAADEKFFVIADVKKNGQTSVDWRKLKGRRFIDRMVRLENPADFAEKLPALLPACGSLEGAMVRLVVEYPYAYENLLDETLLRKQAEESFEFHLVRRPIHETRIRIPQNQTISSLTPIDLLGIYWKTVNADENESQAIQSLAAEIIRAAGGDSPVEMASEREA